MNLDQRQRQSMQAVNLGMGANIFLAALKITVGLVGHSQALLADGIMSTSDVAYYVVVSVFMRLARKPADEEHPYGHSQLESIAALVVGSFVITTGIAIFWDAVNSIFDLWTGNSNAVGAQMIALYAALVTIAIKLGLNIYTRQVGQRTDNPAILALAYDHRNDIFSASGAGLGILLGQFGILWADPLAGALVAFIILRTGVEIMRQSSNELMDAVPSASLARRIQTLLAQISEIRQVEEVHTHRFGPYLVVNITLGVDGQISVAEGDCIATNAEAVLYKNIEFLGRVHVHYHPAANSEPVGSAASLPSHLVSLQTPPGENELPPRQ